MAMNRLCCGATAITLESMTVHIMKMLEQYVEVVSWHQYTLCTSWQFGLIFERTCQTSDGKISKQQY